MDNTTNTGSSATMWIVIVLIVIIAIVAGIMLMPSGTNNVVNVDTQTNVPDDEIPNTPATSTPAAATTSASVSATATATVSTVKSFAIAGSPFKFSPAEIKVKRGETVKITFNSTSGTHDLVIDEFNARTKVLQGGQSETVQFVANKSGTFEYYCSVGNHRQMGMVGKLIVE